MYGPKTSSSNPYTYQNPVYSNRGAMKSVGKDGNTTRKHEFTHNNLFSEVQFRVNDHDQEAMRIQDSGVTSPPLWKTNSPSPARSPSRPLLGHRGNYQPFSPDSRAQAIARGRSELMEMVRQMPESSYELSLKDIVEHQHRADYQAPKIDDGSKQRAAARGVKKEESKRFDRNSSFENKGLFLNMAFPFSFKSKKNKKIVGNNSGRVSPKPEGFKSGGEKDWWKKKFTGSSDSDSSKISSSTGSSGSSGSSVATAVSGGGDARGRNGGGDARGRRKRNGFTSGCWHFFHSRRSKSAV